MKQGHQHASDARRRRFRGFVLDPRRRVLTGLDGKPIRLPARAFDVLALLVDNAGHTVGKDELLERAWKGRIVEENSLSRAISTLRKALGDDAANARFIATLPGEGYRFVASVEFEDATPGAGTDDGPEPGAEPGRSGWRMRPGTGAVLVVLAALAAAIAVSRWPDEAENTPAGATTGLAELEILTDFPGSHTHPALSPDGRWLAFTSDASGTRQIWAMSLEDRVPRQLTRGEKSAQDPAWSPDGRQIAFVWEGWGIATVSPLEPGEPRPLIESGGHPSYSPDGRWLVYEWGRQIRRARPDGSDTRRIEGVPERRFVHAHAYPRVSPDGSEIAYFLADHAIGGDFWRIPFSGGEPRRITQDRVPGGGFDWLTTGDGLVVSSTRAGRSNLWRVPLDGAEPIALTRGVGDDSLPVASPDGKWVVYVHQQTHWELVSSDPATGRHDVILERRDPIYLPTVDPDGRSVAYFSGFPTGSSLVTVDLASGESKRILDDPDRFPTVPAWSSDGRYIYYQDDVTRDLRRVTAEGADDALALAGVHWLNGVLWLSFQPGGDRYLFQQLDVETGRFRTAAHSLSDDDVIEFAAPNLRTPSWTPDGAHVLAVADGDVIVRCRLVDRQCERFEAGGEPLTGMQPRASHDGSRIFLRRRTTDSNRHTIWSFDPATGALAQVLELGPIEPNSVTYDVAAGDRIVWARTRTGESKIWRGRLP